MEYADLMDKMAASKPQKNTFKVGFLIPGEPGRVYEMDVMCRIISKDLDGTTIEILDLKQEDDGSTEQDKPIPSVVPSPS